MQTALKPRCLLLILALFLPLLSSCAEESPAEPSEPIPQNTDDAGEEPVNPSDATAEDSEGTVEDPEPDNDDSTSNGSGDSIMLSGRCEGNFLLTEASELSLIENCKEITGSLTFNGVAFDGLDLPDLQIIGESLFIHEIRGLTNLEGLSSLVSIGKHFRVTNCFDLTSLDGMENLETVGDELYVTGNPDIINIDALTGIREVPGRMLHVSSNGSLENIEGLRNLTRVGGSIRIWNNPYLESLEGFENLTSIGESADEDYQDLEIRQNTRLREVNALAGIEHIHGHLRIQTNNSLQSIDGLNNLRKIGRSVTFTNNYSLPTCEAEELISNIEAQEGVGGEINIDGNNDNENCDEVPSPG